MGALRRFFSQRIHSVRQASALLAVTALLSNILGLARNLIFYRLVPPHQLDVYASSFRIADFLFNLLIFGAITSAFVPAIAHLLEQKKEAEAHVLTNQLLSLATIFFAALIVVLAIFMPWLIKLVVPHFDAAHQHETAQLSRLLLLQTIFFAWSFIFGGLLNGYRRFTTYAFAPLVYNLSIIVGGMLFPHFGLHGIAASVVIGALLHCLIQFREAYHIGFRPHFLPQLSPQAREVARLMLPRSISQGMSQLVLIVYTNLASGLQFGSIAIFSGMNDLQTTPSVIVGNSLATAFFPAMAGFIGKNEHEQVNALFCKVVRGAMFILIPTLVLLFVLRAQIVRLYVGIGSFDWQLTDIAISTFVWFLIGILPASLVAILSRVFYALKDTRTPMLVSLFSGTIAIITAYVGIHHFHTSVAVLAFAESLVSISQFILYVAILHRRASLSLSLLSLVPPFLRYCGGALLLGIGSWVSLRIVDAVYVHAGGLSTAHISGLLIQSIVSAVVGIGIYFLYSTVMNREELQ